MKHINCCCCECFDESLCRKGKVTGQVHFNKERTDQPTVDLPVKLNALYVTGTGIPSIGENIEVLIQIYHPRYGGITGSWTGADGRWKVHVHGNEWVVGDVIKITQSEPFNKDKLESEPVLITIVA